MAQATLLTYFKPYSLEDRLAVAATAHEQPQTHKDASKLTEQGRRNRYQGSENASIHSSLSPDVFSVPASTNINVHFSAVESVHLESIKRLTSSILPVRYPKKFFEEVITDATVASLSRVVHYDDRPVGWIRCRLETNSPSPSGREMHQIYIQALCILAPYRNSGYATSLVDSVLQPQVLTDNNVTFVYAHVWENNEEALAWYEKRGFKRTMLVDKYYSRLRPNGAWIMKRDVSQRPQASHGSRSHPTLPLCFNKSI